MVVVYDMINTGHYISSAPPAIKKIYGEWSGYVVIPLDLPVTLVYAPSASTTPAPSSSASPTASASITKLAQLFCKSRWASQLLVKCLDVTAQKNEWADERTDGWIEAEKREMQRRKS